MSVQHLPATTDAAAVAAALAEDAVVVVDDLAPPELMDRVAHEVAPYVEATPWGPDEFSGARTKRTGGLVARSPACRELVTHPLVLGTVGRVLAHVSNFQLHLTQVISLGPGQTAQPIHRDRWAFDFFPFPNDYDVQCNTIWALTDFTEANGATRVLPGSQRLADGLTFSEADTEPAEMRRGSVLFYTGGLYHGGGANRTDDEVRQGVNITYTVGWLRQEENQYLSVPVEVARELPDDLLRLIGYSTGAYALGYVDDLRSPLDVLRGVTRSAGFGDSDRLARRLEQVFGDRPR